MISAFGVDHTISKVRKDQKRDKLGRFSDEEYSLEGQDIQQEMKYAVHNEGIRPEQHAEGIAYLKNRAKEYKQRGEWELLDDVEMFVDGSIKRHRHLMKDSVARARKHATYLPGATESPMADFSKPPTKKPNFITGYGHSHIEPPGEKKGKIDKASPKREAQRARRARAQMTPLARNVSDLGARLQEKSAAKAAARPKKPYFNPTPEQKAATAAHRTAQKTASSQNKLYGRRSLKQLTMRSHIAGGSLRRAGIGLALLGGTTGGIYLHRKHERELVDKADNRKRAEVGAGALAGGATADLGLNVGGQTTKAVLKERRVHRGESAHEAKIWADHKAKNGMAVIANNRKITQKVKLKTFRTYPKSLPDWRAQRLLALKNKPAFVAATLGAGTLAGGAIVHEQQKKEDLSKRTFTPAQVVRAVPNHPQLLAFGGVAGASGAAHHYEPKLETKEDRKKARTAAIAGGGAVAGQSAYQLAAFGPQKYTRRKIGYNKKKSDIPLEDKAARKAFQDHEDRRKAYAKTKRLPNGKTDWPSYHRNYPKDMPGARVFRTIGHTHAGSKGFVVGTAATLAGAGGALAYAHKRDKDSKIKKSAFGVEN